eukprot:gene35159-43345_t
MHRIEQNCAELSRIETLYPMTDVEEIKRRIIELDVEHRDLDAVIDMLTLDGHHDQLQLRRLKKRKLQLKDYITLLKMQLVPDLILTDPRLTADASAPGAPPATDQHAEPGKHDAEIDRLFGPGGPLSPAVGGFRPRRSQTEMAKAIAAAIDGRSTLMAEAGTGTGKTFAYLVPALMWGGKTIVSTGTKNLQDQLFLRDIPTVRAALQAPVSVALLKGRGNYLCHYHLERTLQNGRMTSREDVGYLREISRFLKMTSSGDKAELARVPENASIWNLVTSTRDNCMGAECQYYQDCFVMKARKEAQQADVVVVNHHLFFADVALKDTGGSEPGGRGCGGCGSGSAPTS